MRQGRLEPRPQHHPYGERAQRDDDDHGHEHAAYAVGDLLDGRLGTGGLVHEADDAGERGVVAHARGAHGEVARAVGRVVQRRDAALLNLPFVERVGGDYPRMEILAESGGNRGVEFHFGDDVLPFALHFGYGRLSGCHRKGLLAFVETFGERRGDGFSRIDLHAVFAREQLQP